jgi:hypothetical protein
MYEIWQKKLVNLHSSACVYMEDASLSGINLQSEVNDMVCEVACSRFFQKLTTRHAVQRIAGRPCYTGLTWQVIEEIAAEVGRELGLTIGIEAQIMWTSHELRKTTAEYLDEDGDTKGFYQPVTQAIASEEITFPFLGYVFRSTNNWDWRPPNVFREGSHWSPMGNSMLGIVVTADVPRMLSNMLYPTQMWIKNRGAFERYNAIRLLGSIMNMGNIGAFFENGFGTGLFDQMLAALSQGVLETRDEGTQARPNGPLSIAELERLFNENTVHGNDQEAFGGDIARDAAVRQQFDRLRFYSNDDDASHFRRAHIIEEIIGIMRRVWKPTREYLRPAPPADIAVAGELPADVVAEPLVVPVSEAPFELQMAVDAQGHAGLAGIAARAVLEAGFGQAWADEMDLENALEGVRPVDGPTLPGRLRAPTAANFGRPPPNVGITNPMSSTGLPGGGPAAGGGGGASGLTATQRKRAQRQRKRAREGRDQQGVEAAGEHFRQMEVEEQEALDAEAAYHAQART